MLVRWIILFGPFWKVRSELKNTPGSRCRRRPLYMNGPKCLHSQGKRWSYRKRQLPADFHSQYYGTFDPSNLGPRTSHRLSWTHFSRSLLSNCCSVRQQNVEMLPFDAGTDCDLFSFIDDASMASQSSVHTEADSRSR